MRCIHGLLVITSEKTLILNSIYLVKMIYKPCCLFLFCLFSFAAHAQQSFLFEGRAVVAGTKEHFLVEVGDDQQMTEIPITVFHGVASGPVLGVTAGVHGYEYSPILAGQRLINEVDPQLMTGTLILVHIANVESFLGRSPYVNPIDGENLNRVFPGDAGGTLTLKVADFISTKVISRCTHFVDAHSGDAPEDLIPYAGYYHNDQMAETSSKGKEMAMFLGFDTILKFNTTSKDYMQKENPSLYCSAQAFKSGIPAVDIECGRLGMIEEEYIVRIVDGIMNLMDGLGLTSGQAQLNEKYFISEKRTSVSSQSDGIFYPLKSAGDYVQEGMRIGYITDFFGREIQNILSPTDGVIFYMLGTPPVNAGETIASIGVLE